jgi:PilZ domain-containing protein
MNDRRRGERSILSQPGMGTVRVTQDVEVTRLDSMEASVITTQTLPVGERVLLEIPDERSAISKARLFRTVKTRFVFKDGRLRREVQLAIIGHTGIPEPRAATEPIRVSASPMIAAISRRVPVRLVEVSTSGCLCDAPTPLEEGSVGFVEVRTPGQQRTEAVRILRTQRAGGTSWPYRMAIEFLTLGPLSPESLRGVAAVIATGVPSAQRT